MHTLPPEVQGGLFRLPRSEVGMSPALRDRHCRSYPEGTPALEPDRCDELLAEIPGWRIIDGHHLRGEWSFPNFLDALAFVNAAGALAEAEQHHPDLFLSWGKVAVEIWTHTVNGLSESDFILAARLEALPR
jgi:4a-hydroxytetrahydrobiopterin dehydratase